LWKGISTEHTEHAEHTEERQREVKEVERAAAWVLGRHARRRRRPYEGR
jgi:hypothetical protein